MNDPPLGGRVTVADEVVLSPLPGASPGAFFSLKMSVPPPSYLQFCLSKIGGRCSAMVLGVAAAGPSTTVFNRSMTGGYEDVSPFSAFMVTNLSS